MIVEAARLLKDKGIKSLRIQYEHSNEASQRLAKRVERVFAKFVNINYWKNYPGRILYTTINFQEFDPFKLNLDRVDTSQLQVVENSKSNSVENGGIDLNQINVKRTGKTINVQFDPAQLQELEHSDFKGFTPVITSFRYIQSPFPLLGINVPAKETEELAKA